MLSPKAHEVSTQPDSCYIRQPAAQALWSTTLLYSKEPVCPSLSRWPTNKREAWGPSTSPIPHAESKSVTCRSQLWWMTQHARYGNCQTLSLLSEWKRHHWLVIGFGQIVSLMMFHVTLALILEAGFRARSQILVYGLTGQALGGRLAAPSMGFWGQNLGITCIPCIGTHLWITIVAKSTLSYCQIYLCE